MHYSIHCLTVLVAYVTTVAVLAHNIWGGGECVSASL